MKGILAVAIKWTREWIGIVKIGSRLIRSLEELVDAWASSWGIVAAVEIVVDRRSFVVDEERSVFVDVSRLCSSV